MFPCCDRPNTSQASYFSRFAVTGWGLKFHLIQKPAGAPVGLPAARVNLGGKWARTTTPASLWPLYAGKMRGDGDRLARPGLAEGAIKGGLRGLLGSNLAEQAIHGAGDSRGARRRPLLRFIACWWPYPTG